MTSSLDPVRITWESGLCRCGCRQPVTRPENQFVNGHGGRLLDTLVDAQREGRRIKVAYEEVSGLGVISPRAWAEQSFTPRGVAWFDWLVGHEGARPSAAQIDEQMLAVAPVSIEEVLTDPAPMPPQVQAVEASMAAGRSFREVSADVAQVQIFAGGKSRDPGLDDDLATVREIVGRAAVEGQADPETVSRLEARIAELQDTVSVQARRLLAAAQERDAILDEAEREAAAAVDQVLRQKEALAAELLTAHAQLDEAVRPITVSAEDLSGLSAPMVLAAARQRALATARVLKAARYDGDADEVSDLAVVFRGDFIQKPRVDAARVFLGGQVQG
ncbi:MAG: hypothetical protein IPK85_03025 [Gemmatimonadetes bacterium]|nr:hypothetical protein [Gemmatimonadota bacterium]